MAAARALIEMPLADLTRIFSTKTRPGEITVEEDAANNRDSSSNARAINLPVFASAFSPPAGVGAAPATSVDDDTLLDENFDANGDRPIRWAKLNDVVSETTYAKIEALGIKGVYGSRVYRRTYPHNSLAAHIVGTSTKPAKRRPELNTMRISISMAGMAGAKASATARVTKWPSFARAKCPQRTATPWSCRSITPCSTSRRGNSISSPRNISP